MKNLRTAVEAVGGRFENIVKTTVYVVGEEHLEAVREERSAYRPEKPPTSTLVVVSRLARPEFIIEIEAVAYVE